MIRFHPLAVGHEDFVSFEFGFYSLKACGLVRVFNEIDKLIEIWLNIDLKKAETQLFFKCEPISFEKCAF